MKLSEILTQVKTEFKIARPLAELSHIAINDIVIDSRLVLKEKNPVFFALDGQNKNGEEFIVDAILKGAKAIVTKNIFFHPEVICIAVENPFQFLVEFLKIFYTPLPANIYGVTGTNGKTSVVEFIRQILNFLGKKSASIGTLGVTCNEAGLDLAPFSLTTPDIVSLYKNLANLKLHGVDDVAIEVSSIGLQQARIAGLNISVAGFTNFTQDHLDYHKSMEEYFFCKMMLFEAAIKERSPVVLNADIVEFAKVKRMCVARKHHILEYGFKAQDLKILNITSQGLGQKILFECSDKKYEIMLNISGEFQVYNVLCALGMIMARNILSENKLTELLRDFSQLKSADGRMQLIASFKNQAQIFIDYAHTPDALENVLKLARGLLIQSGQGERLYEGNAPQIKNRLIVLFGCGGDRDKKKRAIMGKKASALADLVIVTDDNPRSEDAALIRKEILQSCDMAKVVEIADRREAIIKTIAMLKSRDILIIAGKGHEKYQIIGEKKLEFDEEKIVQEASKAFIF